MIDWSTVPAAIAGVVAGWALVGLLFDRGRRSGAREAMKRAVAATKDYDDAVDLLMTIYCDGRGQPYVWLSNVGE